MAKFTDNRGREHELVITVSTIREIKKTFNFDVAKLLLEDSKELAKMIDDPIIMCEICYTVAEYRKPAADRMKVEEFYDGLSGDCLDAALKALLESVADFYPRSEQRAFLRSLTEKAISVESKAYAKAKTKLDAMSTDQLLELAEKTGKSQVATSSPSPATTEPSASVSPSEPSSSVSSSPELSASESTKSPS
jgi:hypothetical protein